MKKEIINNWNTLCETRKTTDTPAETVRQFIAAAGYDAAVETIAAAVNLKAWDGRIDQRNAAWAAGITDEGKADGEYLPGIDNIHPAHLDQIAGAARRSLPPVPVKEVERVSISAGNTKIGAVPSVSLPPVITCPSGVPCAKKCYACRMARRRPSVAQAYERNLRILREDPDEYWRQVRDAAHMTRYFRYHVAGDIVDTSYFSNMVLTAIQEPGTQFLAFTKNYSVVNAYIDAFGELPNNLHVVFSEWGDGWTVPNPHGLPTSAVIFKGCEPADDWKVCPGNCFECACRGTGCWTLQPGETIAFYEH